MEKLEPGLHSTKGIGKTEPDPAGSKELDGCKVIKKMNLSHELDSPQGENMKDCNNGNLAGACGSWREGQQQEDRLAVQRVHRL